MAAADHRERDEDAVLRFWFGDPAELPAASAPSEAWLAQRMALWFGGGAEADAACRAQLARWIEPAARGALAAWEATPRGALALVIVLDQAPRAVHRGTPRAFACDPQALAACERALARGDDRALSPFERAFLYLPLEHAEDLAAQERSVARYEALVRETPEPLRPPIASMAEYAAAHRDVIRRFGRFPHRNAILGRASTPAELAYLAEPGAGF